MTTSIDFQRVNQSRGLRGFANLMHKETSSWLSTRRWWINAVLWSVLIGGLVATMILTPTIVSQASLEEVARAGGATAYAISMGVSAFFEFGVLTVGIGTIILCQGLIIDEKQSGVAEWLLTKPVARPSYVLAKLLANAVFILLFLIGIPSALTYILLSLRTGAPFPWLPFVLGIYIMMLHSLFYLTLTLMLGTFFSSRAPVLGIALGMLFGGSLLAGLIRPLLYITPWTLARMAALVANSQPVPLGLLIWPAAATSFWCISFVIIAVAKFERTEF